MAATGGTDARRSRWLLSLAAGAGLGLAAFLALRSGRNALRARRLGRRLQRWCERGPAKEPVVECEVPVQHGMSGEAPDMDAVEVPIGLLLECDRLRAALCERLLGASAASAAIAGGPDAEEEALLTALAEIWPEDIAEEDPDEELSTPTLNLPWLDVQALAQLTYWYDRRPRGEQLAACAVEAEAEVAARRAERAEGAAAEPERLREAKYGRWTKKLSTEKVVYGTVALRYRTRGHLGQQIFRRPAGVDVTRLATLRRAAALCGHAPLLELVEQTMEQLQPRNVAQIPWEEVKKHTSSDDLWLMIDGRVYDVTPFLDLHPGGGQLIADAAGADATSIFEKTHGEGLRYSLKLLNQFFIGVCTDASKAEPVDKDEPSPEFLQTLRSITGALHTFDEERASGVVMR
eukprot:TRINITY_DN26031_c0_g1_i1.p2 TRINITY_DN26031_c0_g1~~TRINITY_DN26031_c0_g1_i1.p2  ORF type:complete len:431 (-),score=110.44 TRINITY_DN26031_c0_g1_i1:82-1296(-)